MYSVQSSLSPFVKGRKMMTKDDQNRSRFRIKTQLSRDTSNGKIATPSNKQSIINNHKEFDIDKVISRLVQNTAKKVNLDGQSPSQTKMQFMKRSFKRTNVRIKTLANNGTSERDSFGSKEEVEKSYLAETPRSKVISPKGFSNKVLHRTRTHGPFSNFASSAIKALAKLSSSTFKLQKPLQTIKSSSLKPEAISTRLKLANVAVMSPSLNMYDCNHGQSYYIESLVDYLKSDRLNSEDSRYYSHMKECHTWASKTRGLSFDSKDLPINPGPRGKSMMRKTLQRERF